jgi:hypothetical protein
MSAQSRPLLPGLIWTYLHLHDLRSSLDGDDHVSVHVVGMVKKKQVFIDIGTAKSIPTIQLQAYCCVVFWWCMQQTFVLVAWKFWTNQVLNLPMIYNHFCQSDISCILKPWFWPTNMTSTGSNVGLFECRQHALQYTYIFLECTTWTTDRHDREAM